MKRYDFNDYIERCAKIRSTILRLIPATAVSMVRDTRVQSLDLTSVHTIMCTGAPLQTYVVQKLQTMMRGTCILQGYGYVTFSSLPRKYKMGKFQDTESLIGCICGNSLSEATVSLLKRSWSVKKAGSVGCLAASV
jgi:hypothetical protein